MSRLRELGITFHLGMDTPHEWIWLHESIETGYCATVIGVLMLII